MKEHIRKYGLFFVNKQNDYFNRTILMYAALKRQYEVVNYLVLEGANCFLKDYIGSTLIDIIFEQWDEVRREALLDIIREKYPEELMEWHLNNCNKFKN